MKFCKSIENLIPLPQEYFQIDERIKKPKAPETHLKLAFVFEAVAVAVIFSVLLWYFESQTYVITEVSKTVKEGYTCEVF